MFNRVSVVMITMNSEDIIEAALQSVKQLADEIIIVDNYSSDNTLKIAEKYKAKVYFHRNYNLGKQKQFGLNKAKYDWVLSLDADERVTTQLQKEILKTIRKSKTSNGYFIPFRNHFLGKVVIHGGENYKKLRLFKKEKVIFLSAYIHEDVVLRDSKAGVLRNYIDHYSYRSLGQLYTKFTDYALREAKQKHENGEKVNLKKLFLYAPHMFWARFIEDKGYKDGLYRLPLDLGFAYMELLTYWFLLFL